jgi:FMN phosphatase YigB (HAD superfamily)
MKILVIDVGETQIKVLASGAAQPRELASEATLSAAQLVDAVLRATADWSYDVVSIGLPAPLVHGRIVHEPDTLGGGWIGFDFAKAFGRPVKLSTGAAMHALGSYREGTLLFLGLGTGLGSALIVEGKAEPLELAHLPYKDGYTYQDCVGLRGLMRLGEPAWRAAVADVATLFKAALQADEVVIGGESARRLSAPLPAGARLGDSDAAFAGGFALWRDAREPTQPTRSEVVFLLDVDNTLLDNDRIISELADYLQREIGRESTAHYFELFEQLRSELGYADYLGALQRFRVAYPREPGLLAVSSFMVNYPFANRLFPSALDVIEHLGRLGPTVILTDGDVVFQPRKIDCSGLFAAVGGRVLICIHKEHDLDYVAQRFPADHYVLIDDKVRILSAIKQQWGARVTTVFPRQGHYAFDPCVADYPSPDVTVARIGDLLAYDPKTLLRTAAG